MGVNQQFIWCSDGRIVSAMPRLSDNREMCLDVPGGDPSKASDLELWECNGAKGQYWQYDPQTNAISPASIGEKMCVDVRGGGTKAGTLVNLWTCSPGSGEKWSSRPAAVITV